MKKKLISLLLSLMVILSFSMSSVYADTNQQGKIIYISLNRTSLENLLEIPIIQKKTSDSGYVALMTTRGDGSNSDQKSFASIGAGVRANVLDQDYTIFESLDKDGKEQFKAVTGATPWAINNLRINRDLNQNSDYGSYGATLGTLGTTLNENGLKVALLGNSDIIKNGELKKIRNLALTCMDKYGRVKSGNVDDINKNDNTMPYGISTDYEKLKKETKKYYENSDITFVELGDTYRLDQYKGFLNEHTYSKMKKTIHNNISKYLESVFNMVGDNDVVYIASSFPSKLAYKNKERLSPIIKFKGNEKGLLSSSTTRRDGIVANIDVGVDILNEFGLENKSMVGRAYSLIQKDDNVDFLSYELEKMATISNIRSTVVNTFVGVVSVSWVIGMVAILFRNRIPNKDKVFNVIKEFIKLGIIMPLVFLLAPIFNFKTPVSMTIGIIITTLALYLLGRVLFKDDLKRWTEKLNVIVTVDKETEGYDGFVGLVTKYIPDLKIEDVDNFSCAVVGPPMMMKFTVGEFLKRNVAEENIWVSYERKMCCGLGKCGHCKMDESYICLDGPVYDYSKAKTLID